MSQSRELNVVLFGMLFGARSECDVGSGYHDRRSFDPFDLRLYDDVFGSAWVCLPVIRGSEEGLEMVR